VTQRSSQPEDRPTTTDNLGHDPLTTAIFTVAADGSITPASPPTVVQGTVGGYLVLQNPHGYQRPVWATQGGTDQCRKLVDLPPGVDDMAAGSSYRILSTAANQDFTITTTPPYGHPQAQSGLPRYGTNGDIHVGTPPFPDPTGGDGHHGKH
jgi:hypothetical protein